MNAAPLVALVGNPNAGKSALFNALTGARQKVGNYPGVTVENKVGPLTTPAGRSIRVVDLPGSAVGPQVRAAHAPSGHAERRAHGPLVPRARPERRP